MFVNLVALYLYTIWILLFGSLQVVLLTIYWYAFS